MISRPQKVKLAWLLFTCLPVIACGPQLQEEANGTTGLDSSDVSITFGQSDAISQPDDTQQSESDLNDEAGPDTGAIDASKETTNGGEDAVIEPPPGKEGDCESDDKSNACIIEGQCYNAGDGPQSMPCLACQPKLDQASFTELPKGTQCTDDDLCTQGDQCNPYGQCLGTFVSGCCKSDLACNSIDPCIESTCVLKTNTCMETPIPNCGEVTPEDDCQTNVDCDDGSDCSLDSCQSGKCKYQPGSKDKVCSNVALDNEYKCSSTAPGSDVQIRKKMAACDGISLQCGNSYGVWTTWQSYKDCSVSQVCVVNNPTQPGVCVGSPDCNPAEQCCTENGNYQPKGTACGSEAVDAEYKCSGTESGAKVMVKEALPGCTGDSVSCAKFGSYLVWGDWKIHKLCGAQEFCVESFSNTLPGTCSSECNPLDECCADDGTFLKQGTKCAEPVMDTEYQCSGTGLGNKVQVKNAYRGCTGNTATCSWGSANYSWTPWETYLQCGITEACKMVWAPNYIGKCVNATDCKPGTECCDASGVYMAKNAKCGEKLVDTEYGCDKNEKGGAIIKRDAYPGCNGSGVCYDFGFSYLNWTPWEPVKQCAPNATCKPNPWDSDPGKCVTDCDAGTSCCTGKGDYATQSTQCSDWVYKSKYKCSSLTEKGAAVMIQEGYKGCTGTSTYCSSLNINLYWSKPKLHEQCTKNALCENGWSDSSAGECVTECTPGYQCCSDAGDFEPLGAKCGNFVYVEHYKCNNTLPGGQIMIRKAYKGCKGDSTTCSSLKKFLHWTKWEGYQKCAIDEACTPGSSKTTPGKCLPLL
ncbi:MAG TPA: hypothetical protein EYN06_00670 [Myxococcales bacterium]|nr:hypothetical protein [Myxococcales bacterium]